MKIDRELVLHIGKLSHLELSPAEVDLFVRQLGDILHYVEKLNDLKEEAEPFSFGEFLPAVTRPDAVTPSLPVDETLRNAPETVQRFFKVPRILP